MILDIDCGNSRVKWSVAGGDQRGVATWSAFDSRGLAALELPQEKFSRLRVASVAGKAAELVAKLSEVQGVQAEFASVVEGAGGLVCGYRTPEKLGVDRWLAAMAAHRRYPDRTLVLVDAGTALTVDVIRDHVFVGGFIGPGLQMMRASLFGGTSAVQVSSLQGGLPAGPGRDTAEAVAGAVSLMAAGLINEVRARYASGAQLLLTGGDGRWLQQAFPDAEFLPDLVLEGLAVALP